MGASHLPATRSLSKGEPSRQIEDYQLGVRSSQGGGKATRMGAYFTIALISLVAFIVIAALVCLSRGGFDVWAVVAACVAVVLILSCVHINMDWERSVVVRFGKFSRIAGPGLFFTVPLLEFVAARVDQRTMATPFVAEETLTSDLVPVDVDAVLFWMVWDPRKACIEVENYSDAVSWVAQTTLRDAVGRITLAEMTARRDQLDLEMQRIIEEKTEVWGITVLGVEIRDIVIPKELQDAMSKEAQAERERNARVILAEVERDISEMFSGAADVYRDDPVALQLRQMNLVYESVKNNGGVVLIPSSITESFRTGSLDDVLGKISK